MFFIDNYLFTQILKEKAQNGSDSYTFIGRLLDISNENPNFTHDDVVAETATILTGVISSLVWKFCLISLKFHNSHSVHRQQIHRQLHLRL